ncbi:carbohydrate-binding module family 48 protein [Lophiostoma macrostomum CBS 122681]|uniref:Carbohydrate-binding module family 48 protein n=1 Tax=Lophiostoma macrostomum CBS 122681 TaxID=1314788 RepID=A0A6A6TIP8_9PLEO|nr:carbohydrate-binding module family 48 protein [Lophiostoma macrostomum CBS 122681]
MGNSPSNPSRSTTPTSSSHSPVTSQAASHGAGHSSSSSHARDLNLNPRRRESIQALSTGIKPIPPAATLQTSTVPATVRNNRAQTLTTPQHQLRAASDNLRSQSDERMGNEHSKQKAQGHDPHARHPKEWPPPSASPQQKPQLTPPREKGAQQQQQQPSPQTKPVDVPAIPRDDSQPSRTAQHHAAAAAASPIDPADASQEYSSFIPASQYSRPPRLPLPIEEEDLAPGSPIISPADLASPVDIGEIDGVLPRRTGSVLSNTTAEEDDQLDEFQGPQNVPTVPTIVEWEGPGERVYVTGTFAGWNRKYKLHRNGPSKKKDVLSTTISIAPGTHHLKFIVDGDMTTSDKLPTAVDYTNILVNYLEVSLDDIPRPPPGPIDLTKKAEPIPVQDKVAPPGIFPPLTLPPTPELHPVEQPPLEAAKAKIPARAPSPKKYHSSIPRYLSDLDLAEESSRFIRANHAANNLPTPPSLPMFLSKSILNGTTPMKDDSSVLILPNHTVLNHLATSSIKDNILATSATTRYKQKFLTTIMYKPKNDDPDRERD